MIQESSFKSILSVSMLSGIVTQNPSYNWLRAHSHIWINPKTTNSNESKSFTWQNIANLNMNTRSSWHNQKTIRTSIKGVRASYSRPNYAHIGHQELIGRLNLIITMWRCTSQFVVRFGSQMHAATCTQCLSFALAKCPSHPSNVHRVYTWGCDFGQVGFVTDAHLNHACNYYVIIGRSQNLQTFHPCSILRRVLLLHTYTSTNACGPFRMHAHEIEGMEDEPLASPQIWGDLDCPHNQTQGSRISVRGDFLGNFWVEILAIPSPTGYMLTSFSFSSWIWGIFSRFLWNDW